MVDILTSIDIARPRHVVAAFAADPDKAPVWYVNIRSAEWKTPPPLRVGSLVTFTAAFLGRDLRYTYEITEYEPGTRLVMSTREGPFPMQTTYEWETANGDGTRMRLRNRGEPRGFSKLFAPMVELAMRRANRNDLRRLKRILEG